MTLGLVGRLGGFAAVGLLCRQEGCRQIGALSAPHRLDNAHPAVGQGAHGHAVGLALAALAPVIGCGPRLLEGRLPGKLVEGVTQGLDACVARMGTRVLAALVRRGGGARQGLHTRRTCVALPVVAPSCQQPGRQTLAGAWETREEWAVRMLEKKAGDLVVVLLDLL